MNEFEKISFDEITAKHIFFMKILLATADYGELKDLKLVYGISRKMERRLEAIIKIREEEERAKKENNEDTLFDLLSRFNEEN